MRFRPSFGGLFTSIAVACLGLLLVNCSAATESRYDDGLLEQLLEAEAAVAANRAGNGNNGPDLSMLTEEELRYLLEADGREAAAPSWYDGSEMMMEEEEEAGPRYPELDMKQRKFAVNPSFRSYKDASFRKEEGVVSGDDMTDEFFDDSLVGVRSSDGGKHKSGKKASEGPLVGEAGEGSFMSGILERNERIGDMYFTSILAVCSALVVFTIVGAGFCYHRVRRNSKASEDVEYPAYGVTGPGGKENSPTAGTDRKLAQNAQMYHYQHQKQQMIAFDSASPVDKRVGGSLALGGAASDCESDDGDENDYTVYECPGLAPTGEMEVHNPLFQDQDTTPKAK